MEHSAVLLPPQTDRDGCLVTVVKVKPPIAQCSVINLNDHHKRSSFLIYDITYIRYAYNISYRTQLRVRHYRRNCGRNIALTRHGRYQNYRQFYVNYFINATGMCFENSLGGLIVAVHMSRCEFVIPKLGLVGIKLTRTIHLQIKNKSYIINRVQTFIKMSSTASCVVI